MRWGRITLAMCVAALVAASAPSAHAATVCNEAGNGRRGDYAVSGGVIDPSSPARYTVGLKPLGNEQAQGADRDADRPPALRQFAPSGGADDVGTT